MYVLDGQMQPVPIGVAGEIYIGGAGVARGYLNRPELTAEKFITNPFNDGRLYRTGDLGRWRADGQLEFIGRIDNQVKLRGFRIELGEIESVLTQHPSIAQAVVLISGESVKDKQLVAYVVPTENETLSVELLREYLKSKLMQYMVPALFVELEALPLTVNGKIDRKALPAPEGLELSTTVQYVAPQTPTQELLTQLWSEVLNRERVGIHDNFFELGGHSLLATQLIFRIRDTFASELSVRVLFEQPSVNKMAEAIDNLLLTGGHATELVDLDAEAVLDQIIQVASSRKFDKPMSIFLTGATGFLGTYLLYELLQKTPANIYCLVRAIDTNLGKQKIQDKLKSYFLWDETFGSRIIPVIGDLSANLLGLSLPEFENLADQIDVIYHNGAFVHHLWPYALLKAANVLGTQEILRLASQTRVKPVHYISTISVCSLGENSFTIQESEPPAHSQGIQGGYAQSKWVAEKLLIEASNRGLPISIYRPSRIIGHSQTGISNLGDMFCRFIKGCIYLERAPIPGDAQDNLVPVDYVSRAIVHLSQHQNSQGKVFHLSNPQSTFIKDMYFWIRSLGYKIEEVEYDYWQSLLMHDYSNSLYPYLTLLGESSRSTTFSSVEYDCKNTLSGIAGSDIYLPHIDEDLFQLYFSHFANSGFLNT
jgi:thioester reductase-like protein